MEPEDIGYKQRKCVFKKESSLLPFPDAESFCSVIYFAKPQLFQCLFFSYMEIWMITRKTNNWDGAQLDITEATK